MNFDTKYLIRWAIPGWVFLILMIFYFSIMNEGLLIENLKGTLILGLSASIALLGIPLGYLLNQLHHFLFWVCNSKNWVKYFEEEFGVDKLLTKESNKELRERYRYLLAKKHEVGSVFMSFLIAFILVVIFNSSLFQWDKLSTIYCLINLGAVCIWFFLRKYSSKNIDYHYKQLVLMTNVSEEIEENNNNEDKIKKEFMKKISSSDKELNVFLESTFYVDPIESKNKFSSQSEVEQSINSLNNLTDGEKKVAKARLKQFEEDNDVTKFSNIQLVILGGLFVIVNSLVIVESEKLNGFFWVVLFVVIASILLGYTYIVFTFRFGRTYRKTAIYCNLLLEDVLTVEKRNCYKR